VVAAFFCLSGFCAGDFLCKLDILNSTTHADRRGALAQSSNGSANTLSLRIDDRFSEKATGYTRFCAENQRCYRLRGEGAPSLSD